MVHVLHEVGHICSLAVGCFVLITRHRTRSAIQACLPFVDACCLERQLHIAEAAGLLSAARLHALTVHMVLVLLFDTLNPWPGGHIVVE